MKRPGFDPAFAREATTAEEALALAQAFASGRRSWINIRQVCAEDSESERLASLVAIEQMDAASVAKYAALVPALLAIGRP